MARVSITVNANTYDIACPDGEEQNILDLAEGLNAKGAELGGAIGQAGGSGGVGGRVMCLASAWARAGC